MADTTHPSFPQPSNPEIALWRYMDFAKFLWILQNEAIYFARADCLGDPYEGYPTKALVMSRADFVQAMNEQTRGMNPNSTDWGQQFDNLIRYFKIFRYGCYVSCWHANREESAAMWKLYTLLADAICIKTTYARLAATLPANVIIGMVTYVDFDQHVSQMGNMLNGIVLKRRSFSHESEVRAVVTGPMADLSWDELRIKSTVPSGKVVPVSLGTLIQEVYVSPDSAPYLLTLVKGVLEKYGLTVPVKQSEVNARPAY